MHVPQSMLGMLVVLVHDKETAFHSASNRNCSLIAATFEGGTVRVLRRPVISVRVLRRPVIRPDVQLLRLAIVAEGGD